MLRRFTTLRFTQLYQIIMKSKMYFISCIAYKTNGIIVIVTAAKQRRSVAFVTYILNTIS
jgi:hypothetical protein